MHERLHFYIERDIYKREFLEKDHSREVLSDRNDVSYIWWRGLQLVDVDRHTDVAQWEFENLEFLFCSDRYLALKKKNSSW